MIKINLLSPESLRVCVLCKVERPITFFEFQGRKGNKQTRRKTCRNCRAEYQSARTKERTEEFKTAARKFAETNTHKTCASCNASKVLAEFSRYVYSLDGLQSYCKPCAIEKLKLRDPNELRVYYKEYEQSDRGKARQKKYYDSHRESRVANAVKWNREAKKTNLQVRLRAVLRGRLALALKNQLRGRSGKKGGSAIQELGCTAAELIVYLEGQFRDGMSWNNYGTVWHIDHIKPLSRYDLTLRTHVAEVCHFTNLRPLLARENLSKGNRLDWDLESYFLRR